MTAVDWLIKELVELDKHVKQGNVLSIEPDRLYERAKKMEKQIILDAIIYALDEDGHTGDWKLKFANDYYDKLNKGYDIRNTTGQRFFGDPTFQTPQKDL